MSQSESFVFSDKNRKPDDDLIISIIGDKMKLWREILSHLHDNYKDTSGDWNYYNDGKQWMFKMTQKKKTLFWAGIHDNSYKVTFYFGDKAEDLIDRSDLPQIIKDNFKNGKRYGKIRAASVKLSEISDVESVKKLLVIKVKIK
jgi:hypothetical protein